MGKTCHHATTALRWAAVELVRLYHERDGSDADHRSRCAGDNRTAPMEAVPFRRFLRLQDPGRSGRTNESGMPDVPGAPATRPSLKHAESAPFTVAEVRTRQTARLRYPSGLDTVRGGSRELALRYRAAQGQCLPGSGPRTVLRRMKPAETGCAARTISPTPPETARHPSARPPFANKPPPGPGSPTEAPRRGSRPGHRTGRRSWRRRSRARGPAARASPNAVRPRPARAPARPPGRKASPDVSRFTPESAAAPPQR